MGVVCVGYEQCGAAGVTIHEQFDVFIIRRSYSSGVECPAQILENKAIHHHLVS